MNKDFEKEIRYSLLRMLSSDPDLTQREMARSMGISLGKVNYCLSELVKKGFVKVNRFKGSRNKAGYFYILTPHGIEEKARLTMSFLKKKTAEYEQIRLQIRDLAREIEKEEPGHLEVNKAWKLLRHGD